MLNKFDIAITYSNSQQKYSMPIYISGIIASEDDCLELDEKRLPQKERIVKRENSLSLLQGVYNDVLDYLTYDIVLNLEKEWTLENYQEQIIKILNILRTAHLGTISGNIKSISIHPFEVYNRATKKWEKESFSPDFLAKINQFSKNIIENTSTPLFEVARILARLEFERKRSLGNEYIVSKIKRNPAEHFQIIKTKWNSPQITNFIDDTVGCPAIVTRQPNGQIKFIVMNNDVFVTVSPLMKFCRGGQIGQNVVSCQYSSEGNPFGLPLQGSIAEQCHKCRQLFEYAVCLFRKPLCNGYEAKCKNMEFAGNICCGLFGLYVTRLGNDLKIGTAMLTNIVGRLLEQGVGQALVIYPLEGIMTANVLEKVVKETIQSKIEDFRKYGVKNVYRRSPPANVIINNFLEEWTKDDKPLLSEILTVISKIKETIDGYSIDLSLSENKICNFYDNYLKPPEPLSQYKLAMTEFLQPVKGKVIGYRGSLLFIDSGEILDINRLNGYVVRGELRQ